MSPNERERFVIERKSWKSLLIKIEEVESKREREKAGVLTTQRTCIKKSILR